jgi:hypothetical protein
MIKSDTMMNSVKLWKRKQESYDVDQLQLFRRKNDIISLLLSADIWMVLREEPYRYCFHLFDFLCQQMLYMMSRCCNLNVLNKFLNKICTFIWFIFSIISRTNRFNKTFFIMTFNTIWSKSIMHTPKFFVYIYCTWFFS